MQKINPTNSPCTSDIESHSNMGKRRYTIAATIGTKFSRHHLKFCSTRVSLKLFNKLTLIVTLIVATRPPIDWMLISFELVLQCLIAQCDASVSNPPVMWSLSDNCTVGTPVTQQWNIKAKSFYFSATWNNIGRLIYAVQMYRPIPCF